MKESIYKYAFVLFLVLSYIGAHAKGQEIEKKKTITKSYTVKDFVTFNVKNSFGKVQITNSQDNSITVIVDIIVRRKSEEKVQELLDKIKVQINETANEIQFETDIDGKLTSANNESFEINYTVIMPSINPLKLNNSFGETYVADRKGKNEIKLSYGDFKIEQLTGNTVMKISFCDGGQIKQMAEGELEIKYSSVSIDKLGIVKLEEGFSHVNIESAETIDLVSKYGDVKIGTVNGIRGSVSFSGFTIKNVVVELDLDTSYSGMTIDKISKNFKTVNVTGKFGGIKIGFEDMLNATFDLETKFCSATFPKENVNINYQVKGDISSVFRGNFGNGKGGTIKINSSYGDVKLY